MKVTDCKRLNVLLGSNIQDARREHKMSQRSLAEALSVNRTTPSKWEAGEHSPNLDMLAKIHKLLGVPLWYLLPDEEEICRTGENR